MAEYEVYAQYRVVETREDVVGTRAFRRAAREYARSRGMRVEGSWWVFRTDAVGERVGEPVARGYAEFARSHYHAIVAYALRQVSDMPTPETVLALVGIPRIEVGSWAWEVVADALDLVLVERGAAARVVRYGDTRRGRPRVGFDRAV